MFNRSISASSTNSNLPREDAEFVTIPEWSRRVGVSRDSAYRAARNGEIPGCFSVGKLYRVNWKVFLQRTAIG